VLVGAYRDHTFHASLRLQVCFGLDTGWEKHPALLDQRVHWWSSSPVFVGAYRDHMFHAIFRLVVPVGLDTTPVVE